MSENNPLFKAINDINTEKKKFLEEVKKLGDIAIFSANVNFNNNYGCIEIEIKCKLDHFVNMTIVRSYPSHYENFMSQEMSYKIELGDNQYMADFAKVQSSLAKAIKDLSTMKSFYTDERKDGSNGYS